MVVTVVIGSNVHSHYIDVTIDWLQFDKMRFFSCVTAGAAPTVKEDTGVTDEQSVAISSQTGPIQACCGFLLHSLSWLIIIFTFPFSVCLCLKVCLQNVQIILHTHYNNS